MQEALRAEEREKEERQRAQQLEDTLRNTSYARQQEKWVMCVGLDVHIHTFYTTLGSSKSG